MTSYLWGQVVNNAVSVLFGCDQNPPLVSPYSILRSAISMQQLLKYTQFHMNYYQILE